MPHAYHPLLPSVQRTADALSLDVVRYYGRPERESDFWLSTGCFFLALRQIRAMGAPEVARSLLGSTILRCQVASEERAREVAAS